MKKIYVISAVIDDKQMYKIGYTKRDVKMRLNEFKTGNPADFMVVKTFETDRYAATIENMLHKHFFRQNVNGEWFYLSQQDLDDFDGICRKYYNMFKMLEENNTYLEGKKFK